MPRIDARTRRDLARVGLQTAAAVTVVYLVMRWYGLDHLSWAIISALFSIRLASDSTVSVGASRVAAALIGTVLGLVTVIAFRDLLPVTWSVLAALVTACVLANLMATLWPSLTYIAVAAAIIALDADAEIAESLERALAILIGSVGAALASVLVWPDTARARALRSIADALDDCRRLVEASLGGLAGADAEDTRRIDTTFQRHLGTARDVIHDARFRPRFGAGHPLSEGLVAIERLWHGTIVLDRATEERRGSLPLEELEGMHDRLDRARTAVAAYLSGLVAHLRSEAPSPPDVREATRRLREAEEALRHAPSQRAVTDDTERERAVSALRFGVDELRKNLVEIADLFGRPDDPSPGRGTGSDTARAA